MHTNVLDEAVKTIKMSKSYLSVPVLLTFWVTNWNKRKAYFSRSVQRQWYLWDGFLFHGISFLLTNFGSLDPHICQIFSWEWSELVTSKEKLDSICANYKNSNAQVKIINLKNFSLPSRAWQLSNIKDFSDEIGSDKNECCFISYDKMCWHLENVCLSKQLFPNDQCMTLPNHR